MPSPTAESYYTKHKEAMIQALENPKGVKVSFPEKRQAVNFRHMCHTQRTRTRNQAASKMPADMKHTAATPWDQLEFRIFPEPIPGQSDRHTVYISKTADFTIEPIA